MSCRNEWLDIAPGLKECSQRAYKNADGVLPDQTLVFRAFDLLSPQDVRVVVIGQDPYHTPGKAWGVAFGYNKEYKGPLDSSLANIASEVRACGFGVPVYDANPKHRDRWYTLRSWAEQGVLLINTKLTVSEGRPLSHANVGWEMEIVRILKTINALHGGKVVWVCWGAEARELVSEVVGSRAENVISTSHPCRYSHKATDNPFTGSQCFLRVNEYLTSKGLGRIRW